MTWRVSHVRPQENGGPKSGWLPVDVEFTDHADGHLPASVYQEALSIWEPPSVLRGSRLNCPFFPQPVKGGALDLQQTPL